MRLKEKNNFKKFFKKYMIWIVLVVAILIIPATNAKYILQKSASFELKPDQYNLVVTPVTTTMTSATSDINFKVKNNNEYPINVDIVYNGNVVATGITIPAKNDYSGKFNISQNVYDEVFNNNGANMDIRVISPYSAEYFNVINIELPQPYLAVRGSNIGFFGNPFDITKVAKISFSDQGITPPPGVLGSFDVSEGKQGNVVAWYTRNASDPDKYDFVISANGKVKSKNPEELFTQFTGLTDVDFTNFDITGARSLRNAFFNTISLKNINWGGIDT